MARPIDPNGYLAIGRVLGISATRVRQIEQTALVKMRSQLRSKGLSLSDILPRHDLSLNRREVLAGAIALCRK